MGLDMYLTKRIGIYAMYEFEKIDGTIFITKDGEPIPINFNKVSSISEQAAYWRKANAIHKWFVDHCQNGVDDCGEYEVSLDQLRELVKTCKAVLKDKDKAMELLPPQAGFFFGSTDIDEWYIEDLKLTVKQIEPLLKEKFPEGMYVHYSYQSSW
jgi:hypothetical protein